MNCNPHPSTGTVAQIRNRQMAALYLQAARTAENTLEQEDLRRQAAQLVLPMPRPRPVDRTGRLAC
jgi:hypothetical protein